MVQGVEIVDGFIVDTDPATGEVIGRVRCTTETEVDRMVAAARAAQPGWEHGHTAAQRAELIKAALAKLGEAKQELAATMTREMGKVASEAAEEADGAVCKDALIDAIVEANQPQVVGGAGEAQSLVLRDALGVVVVLAPWNFPADEILLLTIPALIAGNAVVIKPSEVAPLTGGLVGRALASALPPGVVALAQGDGAVGARLVNSKVDMVAMTGSSATGKRLMEACAPGLKRLVLELGGKDPMVVFRDADLDKAARDAVYFSLFNCGQVCCSVERIYVDKAVKADFEQRVVALASSWVVGPGSDPKSQLGPMVSGMQRDLVAAQVEAACQAGAALLFQTELAPELKEGKGNFYPITVLGGLTQGMAIQSNETFGPVVALAEFDGSEEEAVRLANDTEYGLASYVYTSDMAKAGRVAARVKAGQVGVNCYSLFHANVQCPWVGHKGSGFGYHSGPDGWRQFSLPKSLVFETPVPPALVPSESGAATMAEDLKAAVAEKEATGILTAHAPGIWAGKEGKHVPQVTRGRQAGQCIVSVPHGMADDHWIEYVWAKNQDGAVIAVIKLTATDEPKLSFAVPEGTTSVTGFEACNQ
mmetsp:Transcript_15608/g.36313  ORF Transcript_15608/g.36313 Transcript_15608/m.36313 type:complete len:591 (-) Transcript_15608:510-2282(-)